MKTIESLTPTEERKSEERMGRDMTQKQFEAALAKHGMERTGFMGYVKLGVGGVEVSMLNAGNRRRDRLAYLLAYKREVEKRVEREAQEAAINA